MNTAALDKPLLFKSGVLYGGLVVLCVITSAIGNGLAENGETVRVFSRNDLAVVTMGFLGVHLGSRTGFPSLLDGRGTARQRYLVPAVIGIGFGIGDVALYKIIIHPALLTGLTPFMQPFPYSLLLYSAGALETEAIHRLIPIPLLMWITGSIFPIRSDSCSLFWVLAVLTSLVEPYLQLLTGSTGLMGYSFTNGFAFNLWQAMFSAGTDSLRPCVRLGQYLVWHIAFGLVTQYF